MSAIGSRSGARSSGAAPIVVAGNETPADNIATPTDAIDTRTFIQLFDGATWDVWRATSVAGAANVTEMLMPQYEDNTNLVAAIIERPLANITYTPTLFTNFGTLTTASVKGSAGNVRAVRCTNASGSVRFLQLHNKATAPAAADVPIYSFPMAAGVTDFQIGHDFFVNAGGHFTLGIGWCISTTLATFTDAATASEHITHIHRV